MYIMNVVDFWIILEGKPMEEMSLSDKIKLLLFNPYTLALLFIVMLIAIGLLSLQIDSSSHYDFWYTIR